jgi:hypothetical protein
MNKDPVNFVVSIVNGLECYLLRDTFLKLQEDQNATNEQLVADSMKWDSYLASYCRVYDKLYKLPVQ